jgi:hypothetical protein
MAAAAPRLPPCAPLSSTNALNAPEALARATADLRARGIDDEVVCSGTAEELMEYLDATDPCASST